MQLEVEKILSQVAEEFNLKKDVVREIFLSQFKHVHKEMTSAEHGVAETYKNIRLPHLGMFIVKKKRLEELTKVNKNEEGENNTGTT